MVCDAPTLISPACCPYVFATAATASSLSFLICSANGRSAAPPGVSEMRPPPRWKRGMPNCSSIALICCVTAGCVNSNSSAARLKLR